MSASVFISHSGKDLDANDPAMPAERRARLEYARSVRDRIVRKLAELNIEVLFDRQRLEPGDPWQAKLHSWLGLCDGAVILLNQEAIASAWVRKEATILAWRRSLRPEFRIVPVLLGGFTAAEVDAAGFVPLDVMGSQSAQLADRHMNEENADALAELAVKRFAGLNSTTTADAMATWIEDVAAILAPLDAVDAYLNRARKALEVSDDDWAHFADRPRTLAYQILHAPYARAYKAVLGVRRGLNPDEFNKLKSLVLPVWVDASAAEPLARPPRISSDPAAEVSAARAFAVNASFPATGTDYVNRAFCCPIWQRRIMPFRDQAGEGQEVEILHKFRSDLVAQLQVQGKEGQLKTRLARNPFFVVWHMTDADTSRARDMLELLRGDYPEITYLLLVSDFSRLPAHLTVTRLLPPLSKDMETTVDVEKGDFDDLSE
jgi:hypothetical protein